VTLPVRFTKSRALDITCCHQHLVIVRELRTASEIAATRALRREIRNAVPRPNDQRELR